MLFQWRKIYGNQDQQRNTRLYREHVLLNARQFIFSVLAVGVAVGVYFGLKDYLGTETVSWLCILGAVPFAAMGFLKYNGMTAEKFLLAFIRSEFLMPKHLTFKPTNTYYEILESVIRQHEKEARKHD